LYSDPNTEVDASYNEDELDMDDTPLQDIHENADSQFYLWARPIVERLVREAMEDIGLRRSTDPERFTEAVQPIINYVIPRYKQRYFIRLWDRLPRQPVNVEDSALECRVLIAIIKLCRARDKYGGVPITEQQYSALRNMRRTHWFERARNWDECELFFVKTGLHYCTLQLSDFFSRRHRSDVPTGCHIWRRDEDETILVGPGEAYVGNYFSNESDLWFDMEADRSMPISQLLTRIMLSGRGFLYEVETEEKPNKNVVTFRSHTGFLAVVTFYYWREKKESEEFFEHRLFEEKVQ
jgi:hypothetical protein